MKPARRRRYVPAAVLVAALVAGAGLLALAGGAAANHDSPGNYTVHLPEQSDRQPGNGPSASIWHLAAMTDGFDDTSSPQGFETADTLVIRSDEIDFSSCTTENTGAFGIDRGNDDPGTNTDDPLLVHREDSQFNANSIVVEFYGEDSFAGEPVNIDAGDQIIAVQNDCYDMPDSPGWYQIFGSLNGTGYDGSHFQVELNSHYFYVCDCTSEEDARSTLGPPPSERGGDASTPTPTQQDDGQQDDGQQDDGQQDDGQQDDGQQDDGQQDDGQRDGDGPTATDTPQGDDRQDGQQDDQRDDGQDGQRGTATGDAADQGERTPTVGDGPGLGAGIAVVALVGTALLVARRD